MKKDDRFDTIRRHFGKFFLFWAGQGVLVWIILLPPLFFMNETPVITIVSVIGFCIAILGLLIETIADYQKFVFKNNSKNKNNFIQTGLWRYSRHPNYFGEFLIWLGTYVYVIPSLSLNSALFAAISPIIILIVLLKITGVPTLERKYNTRYKTNKQYQIYRNNTSLFVPWFPKPHNSK